MKTEYLGVGAASVVTARQMDGRPTIVLQTGLRSVTSFTNRKWMIVAEHLADDTGRALAIRRLPPDHDYGSVVVVEPVLVFIPESDVVFSFDFFDNLLDTDEVLMCSSDLTRTFFTLIDIGSSFQSKKLVVVASAQVSWDSISHMCASACAMRRTSGGVVFVVSPIGKGERVVKGVDGATGCVRQLSHGGIAVIQVSASVFCVCTEAMSSYEVWDCNNLDRPMRNVETGSVLAANQVVGGRRFMLVVRDAEVVVMDTLSGFIVTSLVVSYPSPSKCELSLSVVNKFRTFTPSPGRV
ncbi:hypothetical protein Pelo_16490 [Pelomyxa schiedti]|nr:hypothetical protein Pelo_16490 [Pelomyxa schiedti]